MLRTRAVIARDGELVAMAVGVTMGDSSWRLSLATRAGEKGLPIVGCGLRFSSVLKSELQQRELSF